MSLSLFKHNYIIELGSELVHRSKLKFQNTSTENEKKKRPGDDSVKVLDDNDHHDDLEGTRTNASYKQQQQQQ